MKSMSMLCRLVMAERITVPSAPASGEGLMVSESRPISGKLLMVVFIFALFWSAVSQAAPPTAHGRDDVQSHIEKTIPIAPRDDPAFAKLWVTLHECKASVYVENGNISSEYLRSRGYLDRDQDQKGYVILSVDERLEGLKVTSLLLPTTWAIMAIMVNAPVETVKARLEERRKFKFSRVGSKHFLRKLDGWKFEIFPEKNHPGITVIQCDSDQQ